MKKIKIWTPANDGSALSIKSIENGTKTAEELGFQLIFDKEKNFGHFMLGVTPVKNRISEIQHVLTLEKNSVLMSLYGGYSTNLLLDYLNIFEDNNIIISGKSDLTCLQNGLYSQFKQKSIYGIDFSKFSNHNLSSEEKDVLRKVLNLETISIRNSEFYNDGFWYLKNSPNFSKDSWFSFNLSKNKYKGISLGGNLESLLTLAGTKFMPDFKDCIVILECISNISAGQFMMQFHALLKSTNISKAKLVVLGTFSPTSILSNRDAIKSIIEELKITFPLIANVDISHTEPSYPFYIGGSIELNVEKEMFKIEWETTY